MAVTNVKENAKKLIDNLSDDSTWEDLMHEIYAPQAIESGLENSKAGRTKDVNDLREKYGLSKI